MTVHKKDAGTKSHGPGRKKQQGKENGKPEEGLGPGQIECFHPGAMKSLEDGLRGAVFETPGTESHKIVAVLVGHPAQGTIFHGAPRILHSPAKIHIFTHVQRLLKTTQINENRPTDKKVAGGHIKKTFAVIGSLKP